VVEETGGTMRLLTGFCRTTGRDYCQPFGFTLLIKEDLAHTDGSGYLKKVCLSVTTGDLLPSPPLFSVQAIQSRNIIPVLLQQMLIL